MKKSSWVVEIVIAIFLLATLALLADYLWMAQKQDDSASSTEAASIPQTVSVAPSTPAPTAVSAPQQPVVKYPVNAPASTEQQAGPTDIVDGLNRLFSSKTVSEMFQVQNFVQRFVASVDNLGRSQASTRLWPVNRPEGRFQVDTKGANSAIGLDNGLRYTPYVLLLETVDLHQAVTLYSRFYPQFQQAFEELGYPNQYFNDRFVEVIDRLLATPELPDPIAVHLPMFNESVHPERPWVLYEFDNPALETLSAGQKILSRTAATGRERELLESAQTRTSLKEGPY